MSALAEPVIQQQQPQEEAPTCYICMEEASAANPFLARAMCPCSGKAASSLKIHQLCLELSRDRSGQCKVCKKPLDGNWAFDESFNRKNNGYSYQTWTFTQMEPGKMQKHGAAYTLKRKQNDYYGPMRYLAERFNYEVGEKHGLQIVYSEDGIVLDEGNFVRGTRHGRTVKRNDKGTIILSATYDDGQLHGPFQELYHGLQLGGTYEHDVKVGDWLEHMAAVYRGVRRVSYVAGKKNGPLVAYLTESGEGLPIERAHYRNDLKHGLFQRFNVNSETLTSVLTFEGSYVEDKANGRHTYWSEEGDKTAEAYLIMGAKHGVERIYTKGKQTHENTYEMGVLHGLVRRWYEGKLIMNASYNRGFRHGVHLSNESGRGFKCTYWSDGTREELHGRFCSMAGASKLLAGNYKMGAKHGIFTKYRENQPALQLTYRDGVLDGECTVFNPWGGIKARGYMRGNVSVGRHVLYFEGYSNGLPLPRESVCYDGEGQLHGTCIYNEFIPGSGPFKPNRTKVQQILNFEHGVLHGRQNIDGLVVHMRNGRVHGRCIWHDERGVMTRRLIKEDDGVSLDELLDGRVLRYPARPVEGGNQFADRFMTTDGAIWNCIKGLQGVACDCEDCWVDRYSRRSYYEEEEDYDGGIYCACGMCGDSNRVDYDSD